jgi:hypothetical protein
MRLRRRSRQQPRSPQNSRRSVRRSRMPRSLSLCELTGTFSITFRKPGRAGKTGSMRRCERSLGSKRSPDDPKARSRALGSSGLLAGGGIKSVLDTRLQHLARYVDAIGALIPYQTGITQTRRDTCHLIHNGSTSRAFHRSLAGPGFGVVLNSWKICQAKPPASDGPLPILATRVVRIRFDGTWPKI